MASLTERLSKDTENLKEFFASHKRVYIYAHTDRLLSEHLVYLLEKIGLKPDGFILDFTSSGNSTVCGYPATKFEDIELNDTDGVVFAAPTELATILNLKVKEKNYSVDTYIPESFGKHLNVPDDNWYNPIARWSYDDFDKHSNASDNVSDLQYDTKRGFFGEFQELDKLGIKYGTDKSSNHHDYLRKYELFFKSFRDKVVNILELGVLNGKSIYAFNNPNDGYFKNAKVIGIDINPDAKYKMPNPENFLLLDLNIEELLERIKIINPTIIIDDASHLCSQQIKALFILWDSLPSGGLYIVEDIDTSFANSGFSGYDDAIVTAFEVCRDISEITAGGSFINEENHPFAEEVKKIASETDMISFVNGSCIIVKK